MKHPNDTLPEPSLRDVDPAMPPAEGAACDSLLDEFGGRAPVYTKRVASSEGLSGARYDAMTKPARGRNQTEPLGPVILDVTQPTKPLPTAAQPATHAATSQGVATARGAATPAPQAPAPTAAPRESAPIASARRGAGTHEPAVQSATSEAPRAAPRLTPQARSAAVGAAATARRGMARGGPPMPEWEPPPRLSGRVVAALALLLGAALVVYLQFGRPSVYRATGGDAGARDGDSTAARTVATPVLPSGDHARAPSEAAAPPAAADSRERGAPAPAPVVPVDATERAVDSRSSSGEDSVFAAAPTRTAGGPLPTRAAQRDEIATNSERPAGGGRRGTPPGAANVTPPTAPPIETSSRSDLSPIQ